MPPRLYFPTPLLAEGRNVLVAAAAYVELLRGYRYTYYCLMDDDAKVHDWVGEWGRFQQFLQECCPQQVKHFEAAHMSEGKPNEFEVGACCWFTIHTRFRTPG